MTGTPRAARLPSPRWGISLARARLLLLSFILALLAAEIAAERAWGVAPGVTAVLALIALTWSLVGAFAWRLWPRSRIGMLMMVFGLVVAANVTGTGLHSSSLVAAFLITLAAFAFGLLPAPGIHAIFAYPSGRMPDRLDRRFVTTAYVWGVLDGVRMLLTASHGPAPPWAQSLLQVTTDTQFQETLGGAAVTGWLLLEIAGAMLLVRRAVHATPRERRVLAFPFATVAVTTAILLLRESWALAHGIGIMSPPPAPGLVLAITVLATFALPVAFLVGLLRERLAYARVGDLVRDLGGAAEPASPDITAALARALGDPSLVVAFPVDGGHVDSRGRHVTLPPPGDPRIITPVGDPAAPLALLIHDRTLRDEPPLLLAAGSAARLALENARLHAQVRAQLEEVRASRARIVAASDETRRRLERDLHDGAQQRLLAVGLALQILRRELRTGGTAPQLLKEAEAEVTAALGELRDLAAGIHPAVLTDQGLRPALLAVAERCPVAVTVTGDDPGRLPGPVESAAYFCASEAITNTVKHARAATIQVTLRRENGRLLVTIADDGVGGASPDGTGLRGLADRAAAVDGRLSVQSPPGLGTRILVELPCA
jgi:signal transduction histidine kinase